MPEMKYTKAQQMAIDYDGGDLLISAAAGSGKTATITAKIVEFIKAKKCGINEMLIVTFTKTAAAEMKQRIHQKMLEARDEYIYTDRSLYKYISAQILKLNSAEICTIDSFLYNNIRLYFPTIGLSSDIKIASEREIDELKSEVIKRIVDKKFAYNADGREKWLELCDIISQTRDTSRVDKEILTLADKLESIDCDIDILKKNTDLLYGSSGDFIQTKVGAYLEKYTEKLFKHYKNAFEKVEKDLAFDEKAYEKYGSCLEKDIEICGVGVKLCRNADKYQLIKKYVNDIKFDKLGMLSKKDKTEASEMYKEIRNDFKDDIKKINEEIYIYNEKILDCERDKSRGLMETLVEVIDEYFSTLNERKKSAGIMGYHDLEIYSRQILANQAIAEELGSKYKYIFIDEYQDTNEMQDEIFKSVSKNASRILVGDIKQSIYKFRGAEPYIFNKYRKSWAELENIEKICNEKHKNTIFMSENFRSSAEILSFTNGVSDLIFMCSDIDYNKKDALIHAREERSEINIPVELILLDKKADDAAGELDKKSDVNFEAEYIAMKIYEMVGEYDLKLQRNVNAGDIAVIMRSPSSHGNEYKDALARYGIKSKLKRNEQLEKFAVVKFIICILETINNPLDDIYFSGMLYSKMFGFELDEIRKMHKISEDMPLFVGLCKAADGNLNELNINENISELNEISEKSRKIIDWIETEKIKSQSFKLDVYIENFVNQNKIKFLNEVDNDPNEREALNKIIDLAKEFVQSEGDIGLNSFLEYAEKEIQIEKNDDESKAVQRDTVSIISIHSSKGLEYPICFLAETPRKRSVQDEIKPFLIDKDFGAAMKLPDDSGYAVTDSLYRKIFAKKCAEESIYEEMRMLYVALTRAKDRLIITAAVNDAEKELANNRIYSYSADEYSVLRNCRYIDWILSYLHKNKSDNCVIKIIKPSEVADKEKILDKGENSEGVDDETEIESILKLIKHKNDKKITFNNIPAKVAASDLSEDYIDKIIKNQQIDSVSIESAEEDENIVLPRFMTGASEYTAADKGSALHTFMQFMDIYNLMDKGFDDEIRKMIDKKMISREYAEFIDKKQISKFLKSDLIKKMSEASYIKREFRFNVNLPASDYTYDAKLKSELNSKNIQITVQGVVDCVLRNPATGRLELIDYKTDSLTAEEYRNKRLAYNKLRERHRNQLEAYGKICKKIFNEAVGKMYIYSTVLGELIEM